MLVNFTADANATYASVKPQSSIVSLRKKRIKKDPRGYVDLPFYLDLTKGSYVKEANIQVVSDGLYINSCNFLITVLDAQRVNSFGSFVLNYSQIWHTGETVTFGDGNVLLSQKPLANILNTILLMPSYQGSVTLYIRLEFDRNNFFTWNRGFYIRPLEFAPVLKLEVTDYIIGEQNILIDVENTIPPPCIQGIFLLGSQGVFSSQLIYVRSLSYEEQGIFMVSYDTFSNQQKLWLKSQAASVIVYPPTPPDNTHLYSERGLAWSFISGELISQRTIYFPLTDAIESDFYINSYNGSDDFTTAEIRIPASPLQTIDQFFDGDGKDTIADLDILYVNGAFPNTLVFNQTLKSTSPTTPIKVTSLGDATLIQGFIGNEGTGSCILNIQYENLIFMPSTSIDKMLGGSTIDMISFKFCNPGDVGSMDPYSTLTFKNCQFLVGGTFSNDIRALIYLDTYSLSGSALIVSFIDCLIGVDGPGDLDSFLNVSSLNNVTISFRNCSFLNPFRKSNSSITIVTGGSSTIGYKVIYGNCIFWNFAYNTNVYNANVEFFRCYAGDPLLVSDIVGNPTFGKLTESSPCYRKWLPRYGQNVGWDQTLPTGVKYYRCNLISMGEGSSLFYSNISSKFDVRDKYITEIAAAFIRQPLIMDTIIHVIYAEEIMKFSTEIPLVKTLIARLTTGVEISFPYSTDGLSTDILLLKYPKLPSNVLTIKETITPKITTWIESAKDTECPIVMRYGLPEWYEPVYGNRPYYYFDVYDKGSGVDTSTLQIVFQNVTYKYGNAAIRIYPLSTDKKAYRILFYPTATLPPDTYYDISISISDCSKNKGPIWDNRRAPEVLRWGGLTPDEERAAMIPCSFSISWLHSAKYIETFERFSPPVYDYVWESWYYSAFESPVIIYNHHLYTDNFDTDFAPYYIIILETLLYTDNIEPTFSVTWENIFYEDMEPIPYIFIPVLLYAELDPEDINNIFTMPMYSDDLEYFMVINWGVYFIDVLDWETAVTYNLLYQEEEYQDPIVVWDNYYLEDCEWWLPFNDVGWSLIYTDILIEGIFDITLFVEDLEWWTPYQTITWENIYSEIITEPYVTWELLFRTQWSMDAIWENLLVDAIEWLPDFTAQQLFSETFEWRPTYDFNQLILTDGFNVTEPEQMDNSIFIDDLEWAQAIFDEIYIENFETDFLPYKVFAWRQNHWYIMTDPSEDVVWVTPAIFIDNFETVYIFHAVKKYTENFERLGILNYLLQTEYRFEMVSWSSSPFYSDDYEYMEKLNYFDPFLEDFEWRPSINWYTVPALYEDMELSFVWDMLFVDSFES